jgi:hypothetical protein
MVDIIGQIISGAYPKVTSGMFTLGYTATYNCRSGSKVLSPVDGEIDEIKGNKVTIISNGSNEYVINGCVPTAGLNKGDAVTSGIQIGTTSSSEITLKSGQDLSSLESTTEKKEKSNDNIESSGGLGLSDSEAQKVWDGTVGKAIGISNIPYNVVSKRIKKVLQKNSIEIKDNVLSEELKRIKSLF